MKESALIDTLIRDIVQQAGREGIVKVGNVRVILGALCAIAPDHFHSAFKAAASGTVAEGAELELVFSSDASDPRAQEFILDSITTAGGGK